MRKLRGYILIARPLNCLIGFLSIFVGGLLADKELAAARSIIIASFAEASSVQEETSSMIALMLR